MAGRLVPAGGGPSIPLTKTVMVIGRALSCDIRLIDPVVSNRHCTLTFDGTSWVIEDKLSRNGTMVNRVPVTKPVPLNSGDSFIISAKFRFAIEYTTAAERKRFSGASEEDRALGDDRDFGEHGPATKQLEPHDRDIWSLFED